MSRYVFNLPDGRKIEPAAAGGYKIIAADPPWSYADHSCNGGVGYEYSTMTFEQIAQLPVEQLAAPDCALFMWATYPKIEEALALIPRWGFKYKSIAFQWVKTRGRAPCPHCSKDLDKPFLGLGRWTRGNTEPCLLAVRGKPERLNAAVSQLIGTLENPDELLTAPVGRHSAKPSEYRDRIVTLVGDLPRVELFAREKAPGWDSWGNEVQSPLTLEVA